MSSNLIQSEQNNINDTLVDKNYDYLTTEQREKLYKKTDNFLEAIYLAPELFEPEVFRVLKYRERSLAVWRHYSQFIGAATYLTIYGYYKYYKSNRAFYFKNFCYMSLFVFLIGYASGRLGEYVGNKLYYEKILFKVSSHYNITDEEIDDLQAKMTEAILKANKEDKKTKGTSLENVKFKF